MELKIGSEFSLKILVTPLSVFLRDLSLNVPRSVTSIGKLSTTYSDGLGCTKLMRFAKVVLVGDNGVGKTSLISTFQTGKFHTSPEYIPTLGCYAPSIKIDGRLMQLQLWDTASHEDYNTLRPLAYCDTSIFLLCFSIDSPSSYENISAKWFPECHHYNPKSLFMVVGTKIDLRQDEQTLNNLKMLDIAPLTFEQGVKKANELNAVGYIECSSLTQEGFPHVIQEAARAAMQNAPRNNCQLM